MLYTLLGKKIGMTQVFDENNALVSVTIIEAGPCRVTQVKTDETDGYNAIQIGIGVKRSKLVNKPLTGHFNKAKVDPAVTLKEVRTNSKPEAKLGDVMTVTGFKDTPKVDIVAVTKGRGFQGVVKRYNFSGGPASHGSMFHRRGGSFGQCQWPGHIEKNRKMPGHMGNVSRTVQNLKIVTIIEDKNLILVKGSIPGPTGSELLVRSAKKVKKKAA